VRIDLRRRDSIKQGTEMVGIRVKARVVKNKVAPPFHSAEFDIMFNHGISKEGNLVDLGVVTGAIKKAGAFFTYGDTKLGQGRENAKDYLKQHSELASQLESTIRASAAIPDVSPPEEVQQPPRNKTDITQEKPVGR